MMTHPDPRRLAACAQAVVAGALVLPIAKRFPLAQAAEVQALAERGGIAKVLITVSRTPPPGNFDRVRAVWGRA
jgi:NADPH:quinone reductase-like Zn-dependent oxidoreductase